MASRDWLSSPLLGAALGAVAGAAAAYFLRAQPPSALSVAEVEAIARRAAASAAPREERKYPAVNTPAKQVCVCMGGQAGCAAAAAAAPPAPAPACDVSRSHALRVNAEARADKSPMRRGHFSGAAGCAAGLGGGDGVNWRAWRGPARTCSGFFRACTQSLYFEPTPLPPPAASHPHHGRRGLRRLQPRRRAHAARAHRLLLGQPVHGQGALARAAASR